MREEWVFIKPFNIAFEVSVVVWFLSLCMTLLAHRYRLIRPILEQTVPVLQVCSCTNAATVIYPYLVCRPMSLVNGVPDIKVLGLSGPPLPGCLSRTAGRKSVEHDPKVAR